MGQCTLEKESTKGNISNNLRAVGSNPAQSQSVVVKAPLARWAIGLRLAAALTSVAPHVV